MNQGASAPQAINANLLASCQELRQALAGAMRVIHAAGLDSQLISEMVAIGIQDGIGVRADAVIREAEGAA